MMIRDFIQREMDALQPKLRALKEKGLTHLERLREEMWQIRQCQERVHEYVKAHPFEDEDEEIAYHKEYYPQLRSLHIHRVELYLLKNNLPSLGQHNIRSYYGEQLRSLFAYIQRYEFLYSYFKLKADDLDQLFFTEKGNRKSVLLPVLSDPEVIHTTETGYLFARFIAYEMLFADIVEELEGGNRTFHWTGETVNLIELLHGIHLNGQVNNGEVGIVEFFRGMGEFFGVDLGIPKKGLEALMKRKKLSKTHFTERMQHKLNERMDAEVDLEREKRRKNKVGF